MKLSTVSFLAILATVSLSAAITAQAQYAPISISSNATTLNGNSSEVTAASPTWNCTITSISQPTTPADSNAVVTTTVVWNWVGSGAAQNPYTLYGHGDLNGSQGGQMGGSGTATSIVDGNTCFNYKRTGSTIAGVGAFGNYSNGGTFHPDGSNHLTATIIGETHTTATANGFGTATSTIYVTN
jgi:hypothetical protein